MFPHPWGFTLHLKQVSTKFPKDPQFALLCFAFAGFCFLEIGSTQIQGELNLLGLIDSNVSFEPRNCFVELN
jgi:hypothetical protein